MFSDFWKLILQGEPGRADYPPGIIRFLQESVSMRNFFLAFPSPAGEHLFTSFFFLIRNGNEFRRVSIWDYLISRNVLFQEAA